MGCINAKKRRKEALRQGLEISSSKRKTYLKSNEESANGSPFHSRDPVPPIPNLTERQKELIMQSWQKIQEDMSKVGVVMFMRLFETHPDVQDVFMPFKGLSQDDLRHSSQLREHALRVMGTVEKCLARINEPKKMEEMLHDLGTRHVMYSAKVDYVDLIGPQFIWAMQPALQDQWNTELEEAWSDLFKMMAHVMKNAMQF